MMFFTRKKVPVADLAPQGAAGSQKSIPSTWGSARKAGATPAPDCAVWNDIARALDAKPRGATK